MSASIYERKSHLKYKIIIKNVISFFNKKSSYETVEYLFVHTFIQLDIFTMSKKILSTLNCYRLCIIHI